MDRNALQILSGHEVGIVGDRYRNHPGPYAVNDDGVMKLLPGVDMSTPARLAFPDRNVKNVYGTMESNGLHLLTAIVRDLQPKNILEVGTHHGLTTARMAALAPDARIITVDLPTKTHARVMSSTDDVFADHEVEDVGRFFRGTVAQLRIEQVFADSTSINAQDLVDDFMGVRGALGFDLVLIDAAHDYWSTRHTFERLVAPRLASTAIVIFDDYGSLFTHVGVTDYVLELARTRTPPLYWYAPDGDRSAAVMMLHQVN